MNTRRIAAVVLFAFLPLVTNPPCALAQDDASTVQARARFREGVEAFDKGRYEEARLAFLQAYTLKKHPSVLLNLAQSSAKSGHPLDAAKYFVQYLKEATTATPQQKKDAETGLAEARKQIARIDVSAPAGTEISLDDQGKVGTTPFDPLDVEPGVHTVKSPTQSVTVTAVIGQKVSANLASPPKPEPTPAATPTPAETRSTTLASDTGASVGSDSGKDHGATRRFNPVPIYVGGGIALVGVATSLVFFFFRNDAQNKADDNAAAIRAGAAARGIPSQGACNSTLPGAEALRGACDTLKDNNSKVDTDAAVANIAWIGGLALGGAVIGGWYLVDHFAHKGESKTQGRTVLPKHPALTPYAGWQSGGLSLTGEF